MHWIVRRLSVRGCADQLLSPALEEKPQPACVCACTCVHLLTSAQGMGHCSWAQGSLSLGSSLCTGFCASCWVPVECLEQIITWWSSFGGSYPPPPWSRLKHLRPSALRVGLPFPPSHQRSLLWMSLPCGGHFWSVFSKVGFSIPEQNEEYQWGRVRLPEGKNTRKDVF